MIIKYLIATATVAVASIAPTAAAAAGGSTVAQSDVGVSADYAVPAGWTPISRLRSRPEAWLPAKAFRVVGRNTDSSGHYRTTNVLYVNNASERYKYYDRGAKKGQWVGPLAKAAVSKANGLSTVREATEAYHESGVAVADGYAEFRDAQSIACVDQPGEGGMGIHYVKLGLALDDWVNAATPEALVYEPTRNGRLRLVAVEYVVFQEAWDATHSSPPSLFGQEFEAVGSANRYGLPPFYALHAWVWKHNPSGMFNDWNPRVTCDHA